VWDEQVEYPLLLQEAEELLEEQSEVSSRASEA
jgi:hypothetical protein